MAADHDERRVPLTSLEKLSRRAVLSRAGAASAATAAVDVASPLTAATKEVSAPQSEVPDSAPASSVSKIYCRHLTPLLHLPSEGAEIENLKCSGSEALHETRMRKRP